jgi:hypothetical protein
MADIDDDELLDALGVELTPLKASSRSRGLRTSCAFIKSMAEPHCVAKNVTSLSACMPCG